MTRQEKRSRKKELRGFQKELYPASLSDEDRTFMTFISWTERFRPIMNTLPEDEALKEWRNLMVAEGISGFDG